jgi:hypothetical protein
MGSRIVCCFVHYSAFDSKIMQLANRRQTGSWPETGFEDISPQGALGKTTSPPSGLRPE